MTRPLHRSFNDARAAGVVCGHGHSPANPVPGFESPGGADYGGGPVAWATWARTHACRAVSRAAVAWQVV